MDNLIIFGAKYLIAVIILIAGIYFLKISTQQKKEMLVFATITLPIIFLFSRIASSLFFNPRPFVVGNFIPLVDHAADNGFPSDHTLLSAAVAFIIYFFNKKLGLFLMLVALLVGLARILAGVHHTLDIAGSVMIAGSVSLVVHKFFLNTLLKKI